MIEIPEFDILKTNFLIQDCPLITRYYASLSNTDYNQPVATVKLKAVDCGTVAVSDENCRKLEVDTSSAGDTSFYIWAEAYG